MQERNHLLIDPQILFQKAQLRPGMHIADFGSDRGGHIVFPASLIVQDKGIVYAVDILKSVLESIRKKAELDALDNIHPIWSDLEKGKTAIPEKSLDVIFIINTLSFCENPISVLNEAKRLARDKARIIIVDWKEKLNNVIGPKDDHFVNFDEIKRWAQKSGLFIQEEFLAGDYHKGLVLFAQQL